MQLWKHLLDGIIKFIIDFVKPPKDLTRQEVFSLEDIKYLNSFDCSCERLTNVRSNIVSPISSCI